MFDFSEAQLNALAQDETLAKLAIEIGSFRVCTGVSAIDIGGDLYSPRAMRFGDIEHGVLGIRASLEIEDENQVLRLQNYVNRFAGDSVTWHFFIRGPDGAFEEIFAVSWFVRFCQWADASFRFNLYGNTGFKRRAALTTLSRYCDLKFKGELCGYSGADTTCDGTLEDCESKGNETQFRGCQYAPEPGEVLTYQGRTTGYNPPPPPGDGDGEPWTPDPWETPGSTANTKPLRIDNEEPERDETPNTKPLRIEE